MPFMMVALATSEGLRRTCCRAADSIGVTALLAPSLAALAVPDKGCGLAVPGLGSLLEPGADLSGRLRMLARQGPALEDALDRLGHVQPTAAERRIERHDAVLAQPYHHFRAVMTGKIVPHEQQAQRRQLFGQSKRCRQPVLPHLPCGSGYCRVSRFARCWQPRQDRRQFFLEPAMQDSIGAGGDRL